MELIELRKKMRELINSYPKEIVPVNNNTLEGTAFFPAGDGLYKEGAFKIQDKYSVMVVGQDYDNETNFNMVKNLPSQSELDNKNTTWRNLKKIVGEENLPKCFFTNAIMGLRIGDTKNTGPSIAFKKENDDFLKQNQEFFKAQLDYTNVETIICLGSQLPRFLADVFPQELGKLKSVRSFKQLETHLPESKISITYSGRKLHIIFITHPALYFVNAARRYNSKGLEVEKKLLEEVWGS
jgi:hypothetical protein